MLRIFFIVLFCCSFVGVYSISSTKYDYTNVSNQIVAGCESKYEQAKAIYKWLCDNIAYDTSHTIYSADDCFDNKRGVCQAYCELFYQLSEPIGLKVEIISGLSKKRSGAVSDKGHAWLLVEVDDGKIFIDPTWGAGGVNSDGVFVKKNNCMYWFDVDPYWLIFSHFPHDASCQMIETPIDLETFKRIPGLRPNWGILGFDAQTLFKLALKDNLSFPKLYNIDCNNIKIHSIPMTNTLKKGHTYEIIVEKLSEHKIGLFDNGIIGESQWTKEGNLYKLKFTPQSSKVALGINMDGNRYQYLLSYEVSEPTSDELKSIEQNHPLYMPELLSLPGYNVQLLENMGINGSQLLAEFRAGDLTALPLMNELCEGVKVISMPFNRRLKVGKPYTFIINPIRDGSWSVLNNQQLFNNWSNNDGVLSMTVVPLEEGNLCLAVNNGSDNRYYFVLEYIVE